MLSENVEGIWGGNRVSRKHLDYLTVDIWVLKYPKHFYGPVKFWESFGRHIAFWIDSWRPGKVVPHFQNDTTFK